MMPAQQTDAVIAEVAARYGMTLAAMKGYRQTRDVARVRQMAFDAVRQARPSLSLPSIGQVFGGRHHTTILLGIRAHKVRMAWASALIDMAAVSTTENRVVHSGPDLSPSKNLPKHSTGREAAHSQSMNALAPRFPQTYTQPVSAADALISALRSPKHAAPVLRPIADELEARK